MKSWESFASGQGEASGVNLTKTLFSYYEYLMQRWGKFIRETRHLHT